MYRNSKNYNVSTLFDQVLFSDLESIFDLGVDKSKYSAYTEVIRAEKMKSGYNIHFVLPGYDKEDLKISQEKGYLIVSAKFEKEEGWKKNFLKKVQLPDDADFSSAKASLDKGILTLHIPFKEDSRSFEIKIS
jgi:HSP20 family molecular chaperone IbpA